jgi:hypothetical protein
MMKRLSSVTGLGVVLALALASPSLAAAPKKAAPQPADNSPVVTPDTTPPPAGTAAPSGTVQVSAPGSPSPPLAPYTIPVGGAQAQGGAVPQPPAIAAPTVPQPPPEPAVILRADQCLRTNVERVVRAEPSAKLATDLLLSDVCSDEVDAASLYARNVDALARFNPVSERGRAGLSTAHVDESMGQIVAPPSVDVSTAVDAAERSALKIAPNLRKYAAELVLNEKLRLAALANRPAPPPKKSH